MSSGYLDPTWKPRREFWQAFSFPKICDHCGFQANGTVYIVDLLEGPTECECLKCGHQWSVAIPLGECKERSRILSLLEKEKEFYVVRQQILKIINELHGRDK